MLPIAMVLLLGCPPGGRADDKTPASSGKPPQEKTRPAAPVERHYQLNRFSFLTNLRQASSGGSSETADAMLRRLLRTQKIDAEVVKLDLEGEKLTVRAAEGAFDAIWRLMRALNGTP